MSNNRIRKLEFARPGTKIDWEQIHSDWDLHDDSEKCKIAVNAIDDMMTAKLTLGELRDICDDLGNL